MDKYQARERIRRAMENRKFMLDKSEYLQNEIDSDIKYYLYEDSNSKYSFSNWTLTEFDDGSFYLGIVQNGKREVVGCQYYKNGTIYIGGWYNDQYCHNGFYLSDKICYNGEFKYGKFNGSGTMAWRGFSTQGDFKDDQIVKAYYPTSGFTYNGKHFDQDGNSGCASVIVLAIVMTAIGMLAL